MLILIELNPKTRKTSFIFRLPKRTKPLVILENSLMKLEKMSQQQTKSRLGKFFIKYLKSSEKSLVMYKVLQNFNARSTRGVLLPLVGH